MDCLVGLRLLAVPGFIAYFCGARNGDWVPPFLAFFAARFSFKDRTAFFLDSLPGLRSFDIAALLNKGLVQRLLYSRTRQKYPGLWAAVTAGEPRVEPGPGRLTGDFS